MDNQVFELLSARFDQQDAVLRDIKDSLKDHVTKDEGYWEKIDAAQAQIRLVKAVGGTGVVGSFLLWLWQKFGH